MLLLMFLVIGYTLFLGATGNFLDDLPNGTIYYNFGSIENSTKAEILFVSMRKRTETLPYVCENKTLNVNMTTREGTIVNARKNCDLISISNLQKSDRLKKTEKWQWIKNVNISGLATHWISFTDVTATVRCKYSCRCTANESALAARFLDIEVSLLPKDCNEITVSDTTTTLYTETRNASSDHISTAMTPILPIDSTSKYLWFGVTIAIGFTVLCFGCICCKVCLKQSRKPDVSPYGEPSDVLKSITSEYSTPYDARSSTSAIVTVKAEPKPKRTKTRSFKDSFRNSLRKLTNKKVKKKEEKEDSGYSEIGDFSRTRTIDACTTNSKGKVLHKECIIEYSKADNSNPYAVIFLNKE